MADAITIGNSSNARITAFGDDCKFGQTNAFSYVLFENERLPAAREAVIAVKRKYGFPDRAPLHMRQLTNADQRRKSGLRHLNDDSVIQLLVDVIERMNQVPVLVKGAWFSGPLPRDVGGEEMPIAWSDKGMQSLLAKWALIPLNLQRYDYPDLKIVVSRDATIVPFLGKNRRQAHNWARGFFSVDAPSDRVYELEPEIGAPDEEVLLQLADLVVYLIAHSLDPERPSLRHRTILERVRNIDVKPFQFVPE